MERRKAGKKGRRDRVEREERRERRQEGEESEISMFRSHRRPISTHIVHIHVKWLFFCVHCIIHFVHSSGCPGANTAWNIIIVSI